MYTYIHLYHSNFKVLRHLETLKALWQNGCQIWHILRKQKNSAKFLPNKTKSVRDKNPHALYKEISMKYNLYDDAPIM